MVDGPISGDPLVTTLTGAVVPVVQGGVNKKAPASMFGSAFYSTRSAIAAITFVAGTVVSLTEGDRFGAFQALAGDYSAMVTADPMQGIYIAPASDPTGASGVYMRGYATSIAAKWFGVVGDNSTDDTAAFQAAVNFTGNNGIELVLSGAAIKIAGTITIPPSDSSPPPYTFFKIRGQGRSSSQVHQTANLPVFSYTGDETSHAFIHFSDFWIAGGALSSQIGIDLHLSAFFTIRDMYITGCNQGIRGEDILTGEIQNCIIRNNTGGINLINGAGSPPNAISIVDCEIGANGSYGVQADKPASLRITGGAIEGNGWDTLQSLRCGVKVTDAGYGGGVGLFVEDVYIEANEGTADIWIDQGGQRCQHWIAGNSFSRVGTTNYVTNNIRLDCDSGIALKVTATGNAFRSFGGYTPNAGRLYVDTTNCLGTAWQISYLSNDFESATEVPKLGPRISAVANTNLADQFDTQAPRHVAGRWCAPMPLNTAANTAFGQNVIGLQMFTLGDTVTIDQIGTYVSTLSAGGKMQLAIYANDPATALPTGNPLLKTGDISTSSVAAVSAAVVANAQLTPGLYWMAAMMDNAVAAVVGYQAAMPLQPFFSGSATLSDIASSSSIFDFVIRVTNTFGSGWPDLTSATKTVTPGTLAPVVFFHTASVP